MQMEEPPRSPGREEVAAAQPMQPDSPAVKHDTPDRHTSFRFDEASPNSTLGSVRGPPSALDASTSFRSHAGDDGSLADFEAGSEAAGSNAQSAFSGVRPNMTPNNYYLRLSNFYLKYNPEKLGRVDEFLAAYKGEEESLFHLLVAKYGDEPDLLISAHDLPRSVSGKDGNTDAVTPYWPGSKAITDTDLCSLLASGKPPNENVATCLKTIDGGGHPTEISNGLLYFSDAPLPTDPTQPFIGHTWSGTLSNNKALVHGGQNFNRMVMHCTNRCQVHGDHKRWRMTMYSCDGSAKKLFRFMWDPEIYFPSMPADPNGRRAGSNCSSDYSSPQQGTQHIDPASPKPLFTFSWAKRSKHHKSPPSSQQAGPSPVRSPRAQPAQPAQSKPFSQPTQPQAAGGVDLIMQRLTGIEARLDSRLSAFESRIGRLEDLVATLAAKQTTQPQPHSANSSMARSSSPISEGGEQLQDSR